MSILENDSKGMNKERAVRPKWKILKARTRQTYDRRLFRKIVNIINHSLDLSAIKTRNKPAREYAERAALNRRKQSKIVLILKKKNVQFSFICYMI